MFLGTADRLQILLLLPNKLSSGLSDEEDNFDNKECATIHKKDQYSSVSIILCSKLNVHGAVGRKAEVNLGVYGREAC